MHAEQTIYAEAEPDLPASAYPPGAVALPVAAISTSAPARLIEYAMQQNADMDRLEKLLALQERWEANEARKAYHLALAGFKAEPLVIAKDKRVYFESKDGTSATDYMHATLGGVVRVIAPALAKHRLSHSWDVQRDGERIRVICKLTHALGHSESISLEGPLDTSGKKNAIQQQASTITYLERYTLLAITGLATEDGDDDGRGSSSGGGEEIATITEEQAAKLQDALEATGRSLDRFKAWLKVEKLTDLPAEHFELAMREASKPKTAAKQ